MPGTLALIMVPRLVEEANRLSMGKTKEQELLCQDYQIKSFNKECFTKFRYPCGERSKITSSHDRSERDVPSHSSQLQNLKFYFFDRNPLEWPEWSNLFVATVATVHNNAKTILEKMSYWKTLLNGKTRAAIASMGYSGEQYGKIWAMLERIFGQPYPIVEAQPVNHKCFPWKWINRIIR